VLTTDVGKILIAMGGLILLIGVALLAAPKLLGRLPGDILIQRDGLTIYFPIVTSIVISIVLTVLLNVFSKR
jgi:hypothetical protein